VIIDHRTYEMHPGRMPDWLALWEREALPLQIKYLEGFVGMFRTEVGPMNEVVHLWRYADMADRERRRNAMEADPAWQQFRRNVAALGAIRKQHTKILVPVPFSPMR